MVDNEETRRTTEKTIDDFLPKNAFLPDEEMLQKYGDMPVEEQRKEFPKLVSYLNTKTANEKPVLFLMLLGFTNPTIILKHMPDPDKEMHKKIMEVAILFEDCLKKLNEIPNEKLPLFVERMSTSEKIAVHTFANEMMGAFLQYPQQHSDDSAMIYSYMSYAHGYSGVLLQQKGWIAEMVEDFKSGTEKSKRRVLEEGKKAFEKSKDDYKHGGKIFLRLTSLVAVLLLLWGGLLGFNILCFFVSSNTCFEAPSDNSYLFIASSIVGKIIVSATLFFLLGAFLKVYFACKHNETICRQRHDVLSSYEDIYKTVNEKIFILQKVAEAVFSHQPTGFSKLQSDKGDSSISLADVVNMIPKNSDKV